MGIRVHRVTNANVYFNGNNAMGRAEEVTLPDVQAKMTDHKALGMVSELELVAGLQKMSCKIKWNSIYPDIKEIVANPLAPIRAQVRASIEQYEGSTKGAEIPAVFYMTLQTKKVGGTNFKPNDNVEIEDEFNVLYFKEEVNGKVIQEIDAINNIWRVNGRDLLQQYRANLGI